MISSRSRTLRTLTVTLAAAGSLACAGAPPVGAQDADTPHLVVLVSVDQLRGDLLDRYADVFTGGLARLMTEGHYFPNATHDHSMTETAPGHASLATGVYPVRHGIVGNNWTEYVGNQGRSTYAVGDSTSPIVGFPNMDGRSPANFERDGLGDWILDADSDARVVSLSRKDRGAIGLASRARGDVFWIHQTEGRFVTSSYYMDEYPEWIERVNEEVMPEVYSDTIWASRIPPEFLSRTRPDTSEAEGVPGRSAFPHLLRAEASLPTKAAANSWRYSTPAPDAAVLRAAAVALEELELGRRGVVDFLSLALSQTDAVGHAYGPLSREQLDNLLHLDRELDTFLEALDAFAGEGNWVIGFSADHGALDVPEHLEPPMQRITPARQNEIFEPVRELLGSGTRGAELTDALVEALEAAPEVAEVLTSARINGFAESDTFAVLYRRNVRPDRHLGPLSRLGMEIRLEPNYLPLGYGPRGTGHGSPYYYDRWVPLIFMGPGITPARDEGAASTVDMAPTLAAIVGVEAPDDLDGRMLIGR